MPLESVKLFFKQLLANCSQDRIASQSAALAYYIVFSLTPILLICILIVGVVFGEEVARGKIFNQIGALVGNKTALQMQQIVLEANKPQSTSSHLIGIIILVLSASGFFSELQTGLNVIWGVKAPKKGWLSLIKDRFLSFTIVLSVAFILLVSLLLSAFLTTLSTYISQFMDTSILSDIILSDLISFCLSTLLFAMMFKVLPDVEIKWKDVWEGALFTALLFSLGKLIIGIYLSKAQVISVFGAAGSFIVILVWVYYSAQIFFIGAEITKIFSTHKGKEIIPMRNAVVIRKNPAKTKRNKKPSI